MHTVVLLGQMLALGNEKKQLSWWQKFSPEQSSGPSLSKKNQTTHKICNFLRANEGKSTDGKFETAENYHEECRTRRVDAARLAGSPDFRGRYSFFFTLVGAAANGNTISLGLCKHIWVSQPMCRSSRVSGSGAWSTTSTAQPRTLLHDELSPLREFRRRSARIGMINSLSQP